MEITAERVRELREKTGLGMMLCKKALTESAGDMEKAIDNLRKQGETTAAKRASKAAKEGKVSIVTDGTAGIIYEVNSETDFVARNDDFLAFVKELGAALIARKPADIAAAKALSLPGLGGRTVEENLTALIGKIGENISFRRFQIMPYDPSCEGVFTYIHGNGKIGVMVSLRAADGAAIRNPAVAELGKDLAMQVTAANPIAADRSAVPAAVVDKEKEIYLTQAKNSGKPEKIWDKIVEGKLAKFYAESVLVEQVYIKNTEIKVSDRIKETEKAAGSTLSVKGFVRCELGSEA